MRTGICHCLALYDWKSDIDTKSFCDIAINVFHDNNKLPNLIKYESADGNRHSSRSLKRICKQTSAAHGTIQMYHTIEGYSQLIFGWNLNACKIDSDMRIITLGFGEFLSNLTLSYISRFVDSFASLSEFAYGMCYSRSFNLGPDLYAYGMITGQERTADEKLDEDRITAWLHDRINEKRHLKGYLRDVYPMNILSEKHLLREVDGQLLPEWIASDTARGTIRKIGIANWLWTVPNESLPNMQAILRSRGLTIVPPDPETSS